MCIRDSVREDDAGQDLDAVGLQHLLGDLLALAGLERIVLDDELDRHAAELAALQVDGEFERVADVLAEIAARP